MLVRFRLNGEPAEHEVPANVTLLDFLRDSCGLLSVKKGCDEGQCVACTVLVDGKPLCACLVLVVQMQGAEITTLEGLSKSGELSYVQKAFLEKNGFQCGFCTPGMVLATKALLDHNPSPSVPEIQEALSGNLCRCTGYRQIIEAVSCATEMRDAAKG
ncbi:MAG: (2Fe-2S)-binding protein [Hyphomicrobiales bacterium]|nr:(2Fe-2S)-binding protein [Hyphomicrobiales bacterium]